MGRSNDFVGSRIDGIIPRGSATYHLRDFYFLFHMRIACSKIWRFSKAVVSDILRAIACWLPDCLQSGYAGAGIAWAT